MKCPKCQSKTASFQPPEPSPLPTSFADDRFEIKEPLGEGARKKVYLAYDKVLDREVAIALIKTEGLDEAARARMIREYQKNLVACEWGRVR